MKIRGGSILPVFIYRWGIRRFFPGHAGFEAEERLDGISENLLILLDIGGEEDPVGEGGRGVRRAMEDLQETGCTNVAMQLYPGQGMNCFMRPTGKRYLVILWTG